MQMISMSTKRKREDERLSVEDDSAINPESHSKVAHPRHALRLRPPNFAQLRLKYPSLLGGVVKVGKDGVGHVNFRNEDALRAITRALLLDYYSLDVCLPPNRLVPTVTLRANYIHWIEDLVTELRGDVTLPTNVIGIDIGTGASCIYPLLGARIASFDFVATEIDSISFDSAVKNVEHNKLIDRIAVVKANPEDPIVDTALAARPDIRFDFLMCNPPFFDVAEWEYMAKTHPGIAAVSDLIDEDINNSTGERESVGETASAVGAPKRRRPNFQRKPALSASTGTECEMATEGGELGFVGRIVSESLVSRGRVRWYTSMLGKKATRKHILRQLRESGVPTIRTATFFQGRTLRWAVAWSFEECPSPVKGKEAPPTDMGHATKRPRKASHAMSVTIPSHIDSVRIRECTLSALHSLGVTVMQSSTNEPTYIASFEAVSDTWSHQRKRRRQQHYVTSGTTEEPVCIQERGVDVRLAVQNDEDTVPVQPESLPSLSAIGCRQSEAPLFRGFVSVAPGVTGNDVCDPAASAVAPSAHTLVLVMDGDRPGNKEQFNNFVRVLQNALNKI